MEINTHWLVAYLVAVNIIAFWIMARDKMKARAGRWRTAESSILSVAVLGGAAGVFLGMKIFRHKTRHRKFNLVVPPLILAHGALLWWVITRYG